MKIFNRNIRYSFLLLALLLIWGSIAVKEEALSQASNYDSSSKYGQLTGLERITNSSTSIAKNTWLRGNTVLEDSLSGDVPEKVPKPTSVMYKSAIIPGWGQIVNKQAWKVPIVYALIAGVTYYSIYLNGKYNDYKAAYYNQVYPDKDQKFGPTPDYINPNISESSLKSLRNDYRNQRDKAFIGIGLAYGLNILDAYVFAHLRDFDVSDDLSMNMKISDGRTLANVHGQAFSQKLYDNSVMISLNFKLKTQ